MLLSVVVPCRDEEQVLAALVREVLAVPQPPGTDVELVLVDDGSRDASLEVMQELCRADRRVRYVSLSRNFGKESAMLAGLAYARGDAIVLMDADLQHPPRLIPQMLELHAQGYDQVVGRRTREGDTAYRRFLARAYYRLANAVVDVDIEDGVGDFRLLSRRAVDALLQLGECNRFSKGLFAWIGFPTATIDYRNEARQGGGASKWTLRRLVNYGVDGVLSFNSAPLRLAIYVGTAVTGLAFLYAAFLVVGTLTEGVTVPGYVSLIVAVLGLGGLQLLFLGVIGEYVGRIYSETKQRPHFLVAAASDPGPGVPGPRRGRTPVRDVVFSANRVGPAPEPAGEQPTAARRDPRPSHV